MYVFVMFLYIMVSCMYVFVMFLYIMVSCMYVFVMFLYITVSCMYVFVMFLYITVSCMYVFVMFLCLPYHNDACFLCPVDEAGFLATQFLLHVSLTVITGVSPLCSLLRVHLFVFAEFTCFTKTTIHNG